MSVHSHWPLLFLVWLFALLPCIEVEAHKPSDSYLRIQMDEEGEALHVQWEIALKDLELLIGIDSDGDRNITWGELKERRDAIAAHALNRLEIKNGIQKVELAVEDLLFTEHSDGGYAVLVLTPELSGSTESLSVRYDLLFDIDPTHRGLVVYDNGDISNTYLLSPSNDTIELSSAPVSLWTKFLKFIWEGIWHIWIGFDHILFLIALLLPAVLYREKGEWRPVPGFLPACLTTLKIVSVFTLAHSITLWLAVMDYVSLPSRFIEATIAASIIVVVVNNFHSILKLSGWMIAFIFGLIHGFGFANVLVDLGLSASGLAISLFGFNVGVELGQLAIVFVLLPIIFLARGTTFYRRYVYFGGSILIGIIALIWFLERAFNLNLTGG